MKTSKNGDRKTTTTIISFNWDFIVIKSNNIYTKFVTRICLLLTKSSKIGITQPSDIQQFEYNIQESQNEQDELNSPTEFTK